MSFSAVICVGLGGMVGAISRYFSMAGIQHLFGNHFPYATLSVNVIGSFILGIITASSLMHHTMHHELRLFFIIGLLGSFTTFSTFSLDAFSLYERGEWFSMALYIGASLCLSILALMLGMALMRSI